MPRVLIHAAAALAIVLLAGCASNAPAPRNNAICLALQPAYPLGQVSYSSKHDTPETVASARLVNKANEAANARLEAACQF